MLPSLLCPKCGSTLRDIPTIGYPPLLFKKCRRRCDPCGVGYSNARKNPVLIYEKFEDSIPKDVRNGLSAALSRTFNIANQFSKRENFCSEHSEDAVTWTIFKYMMMDPLLPGSFPAKVAKFSVGVDSEVLLWGAPITTINHDARASFIKASTIVGEKANYRTEPDVIMDYGKYGLIFIECKYLSPNSIKPPMFKGWDKYDSPQYFKNFANVRQGGLYQLTRMWRMGNEMAENRPFTLINIVRKSDLAHVQAYNRIHFGDLIQRRRSSHFITISWDTILDFFNSSWAVHHYASIKDL